jgi:hypothetical protein
LWRGCPAALVKGDFSENFGGGGARDTTCGPGTSNHGFCDPCHGVLVDGQSFRNELARHLANDMIGSRASQIDTQSLTAKIEDCVALFNPEELIGLV